MKNLTIFIAALTIISCNNDQEKADAYGNFEVAETIISAQASGELLMFNVEEGDQLSVGQIIGQIDSTDLVIQKAEIIANRQAVAVNKSSISAEINVMEAELKNLIRERDRVKKMIASEAATSKQLDDLEGNVNVIKSKMQALKSQYNLIDAQVDAIDAKMAMIEERLSKCNIVNPVNGTVLTKLAQQHELVAPGRPLFKLANMENVYLLAYISEPQLTQIKLGQEVSVSVDEVSGMKSFPGTLTWVSSEAEFTPKIIQTKEERVNLVYAIKIKVINDGSLKLGMPAEVNFQ